MATSDVPLTITARYLKPWNEQQMHPTTRIWPTTYRLIVRPTFDHPRLFRVSRRGNAWEIAGKIGEGLGGYFIGDLTWKVNRRLNAKEATRVNELLRALDFWNMAPSDSGVLLDGTWLALEGTRVEKYHVIQRYCPAEQPLMAFIEYLEKVSGAHSYLLSREAQEQRSLAVQKINDVAKAMMPEARTAAALTRYNKVATRLSERALKRGLRCPHCHITTRRMRFINRDPEGMSFFICGLCARSFDAEQYGTLSLAKSGGEKS